MSAKTKASHSLAYSKLTFWSCKRNGMYQTWIASFIRFYFYYFFFLCCIALSDFFCFFNSTFPCGPFRPTWHITPDMWKFRSMTQQWSIYLAEGTSIHVPCEYTQRWKIKTRATVITCSTFGPMPLPVTPPSPPPPSHYFDLSCIVRYILFKM